MCREQHLLKVVDCLTVNRMDTFCAIRIVLWMVWTVEVMRHLVGYGSEVPAVDCSMISSVLRWRSRIIGCVQAIIVFHI